MSLDRTILADAGKLAWQGCLNCMGASVWCDAKSQEGDAIGKRGDDGACQI